MVGCVFGKETVGAEAGKYAAWAVEAGTAPDGKSSFGAGSRLVVSYDGNLVKSVAEGTFGCSNFEGIPTNAPLPVIPITAETDIRVHSPIPDVRIPEPLKAIGKGLIIIPILIIVVVFIWILRR